ncbi:BGTF surface domain-containing protein [Halobellus limi]|uniref:PGF-CTERM protein/surface glycoprotein n=1 Tax=Halobellus limi TaxID=699433 RepID=A0A1H5UU15_9EURY|nr:BGTF surface domain-containing protein [Halobellus limi]QCC46917.1 PGF-CTERM sorting domain-containing protein [Halobellus limi]SEF78622.1 PGF-CTERM protein/surface glycoprotein [Halobellus limi]
MTDHTNQRRAVFLAAVMICSVFAGVTAFAGSTAADLHGTDNPVTVENPDTGATTTHTLNVSASDGTWPAPMDTDRIKIDYSVGSQAADVSGVGAGDVTVVIDEADGSTTDVDVDSVASSNGGETLTIELSSVEDVGDGDDVSVRLDGVTNPPNAGTYNVNFRVSDGGSGAQIAELSYSIGDQSEAPPQLTKAVHYDDTGDEGVGVELAFSEAVDIAADDVTLYEDDSEVDSYTVEDTGVTGRVFVTTDGELLTGDLEVELSDDVADLDGNTLVDTGRNDVTFAPVTVKTNDDRGAYRGSTVAIVSDSGTDVGIQIEGPDQYFFDGSTDTNSEVFVFDTEGRDLGEYNFGIAGSDNEDTRLDLRDLGLAVTVDDATVTNAEAIEGTVEARSADRPLTVELLDGGGDTVDGSETAATLNGQGEYDFAFDLSPSGLDVDPGTYTVRVTDDYSGVEADSSDVTVRAASEEDAQFASGTVTDQRGDVVAITVDIERTDQATVTVGTEEQGLVSTATVEDGNDDGTVTLYLDTSIGALAQSEGSSSTGGYGIYTVAADDDEVVAAGLSSNVDDLIDAGTYDLEVTPGRDASADSTDIASLVLEERGTTAFDTWTAPGSLSVSDLEDVTTAIENDELTRASEVARGDKVVHRLQASGFEGVLGAQGDEDVTAAFFDNAGSGTGIYDLTVEQSQAGANQDPFEVALGPDNTTVVADGDGDTYYVVVDTSAVTTTRSDGELPADESLTAEFTVYDDDSTDFLPDDVDENQTTSVDYDVVEPEITVSEPHDVAPAGGQTITGTTTYAPGTELRVRVRSAGETSPSFLKTAAPTVGPDRRWSATLDFAEQNVGDTYEIVVEGDDAETTEDGEVVEAVETPAETPGPDTDTPDSTATDTATAEPDTTTAASEPGTTEPATETSTATPGFGVVVALTALLAAALLAARRER